MYIASASTLNTYNKLAALITVQLKSDAVFACSQSAYPLLMRLATRDLLIWRQSDVSVCHRRMLLVFCCQWPTQRVFESVWMSQYVGVQCWAAASPDIKHCDSVQQIVTRAWSVTLRFLLGWNNRNTFRWFSFLRLDYWHTTLSLFSRNCNSFTALQEKLTSRVLFSQVLV